MPNSLQNSYRTASDDYRARNNGSYPPFSFIVQYLSKKCREFSDAYFHHSPLTFESRKKEPTKTAQAFTSKLDENQNISSNKAVHLSNQSKVSCLLHDNSKHNLSDCHKFAKLPHSEKINLLKKNRCCFKCFGNHMKSNCSVSVKCDRCLGNHLTAMHIDRNDSADTNPDSTKSSMCTKTCNDPSSLKDCSKVVLVDLSLKSSDKAPLRAYAILDEQSNSSFVDPKVAEYFEISGPVTDYTLQTLHGSSSNVQSVTIKDLFAKGVKEKTKFALPTLYTNLYIPNCKSEIASRDTVQRISSSILRSISVILTTMLM